MDILLLLLYKLYLNSWCKLWLNYALLKSLIDWLLVVMFYFCLCLCCNRFRHASVEFTFVSSRSKFFKKHISDVCLIVILFCLDINVNISLNNKNVGTCMLNDSGKRVLHSHMVKVFRTLEFTSHSQVIFFVKKYNGKKRSRFVMVFNFRKKSYEFG
jgi:hypothetical protein